MILVQQMYPGSTARPRMDTMVNKDGGIFVATTAWGEAQGSRVAVETVNEYYSLAKADPEATSPFPKVPQLSTSANHLRIGTLLANEAIFARQNAERYRTAAEMLALVINESELSWVQVGQPHMLLWRNDTLTPVQAALDLNLDEPRLAPLPRYLLGINRHLELETKSMTTKPGDRLILLARPSIPPLFFTQKLVGLSAEKALQVFVDLSVNQDAGVAFWLGILEL